MTFLRDSWTRGYLWGAATTLAVVVVLMLLGGCSHVTRTAAVTALARMSKAFAGDVSESSTSGTATVTALNAVNTPRWAPAMA